MRTRVLAWASLLLLPAAGAGLVSACGQTNDTGDSGTTDAAPDKTTNDVVTQDVVEEPDASCPPPLQLDGGFLLDAGSFGPCITCLATMCGSQVNACNGDCACRQAVSDTINCFVMSGTPSCVDDLAGNNNGVALLSCAAGHCQATCLGGGGDGGSDASPSDASSDAKGD